MMLSMFERMLSLIKNVLVILVCMLILGGTALMYGALHRAAQDWGRTTTVEPFPDCPVSPC
jgi:hypothetical protein